MKIVLLLFSTILCYCAAEECVIDNKCDPSYKYDNACCLNGICTSLEKCLNECGDQKCLPNEDCIIPVNCMDGVGCFRQPPGKCVARIPNPCSVTQCPPNYGCEIDPLNSNRSVCVEICGNQRCWPNEECVFMASCMAIGCPPPPPPTCIPRKGLAPCSAKLCPSDQVCVEDPLNEVGAACVEQCGDQTCRFFEKCETFASCTAIGCPPPPPPKCLPKQSSPCSVTLCPSNYVCDLDPLNSSHEVCLEKCGYKRCLPSQKCKRFVTCLAIGCPSPPPPKCVPRDPCIEALCPENTVCIEDPLSESGRACVEPCGNKTCLPNERCETFVTCLAIGCPPPPPPTCVPRRPDVCSDTLCRPKHFCIEGKNGAKCVCENSCGPKKNEYCGPDPCMWVKCGPINGVNRRCIRNPDSPSEPLCVFY